MRVPCGIAHFFGFRIKFSLNVPLSELQAAD